MPQPQISPVAWSNPTEPCPEFVGFLSRESLPACLIWSGRQPVPAIAARVHIYLNSIGPAEVKAYYHADGFLGVICQPDTRPAWWQKQMPGVTAGHVTGRELDPYDPAPRSAAVQVVSLSTPPPLAQARQQFQHYQRQEWEGRDEYAQRQREAQSQYPHDEAAQQRYCNTARQVLAFAQARTAEARRLVEVAEQAPPADVQPVPAATE